MKQCVAVGDALAPLASFRVFQDAAPLKRGARERRRLDAQGFRVFQDAAPLKLGGDQAGLPCARLVSTPPKAWPH